MVNSVFMITVVLILNKIYKSGLLVRPPFDFCYIMWYNIYRVRKRKR